MGTNMGLALRDKAIVSLQLERWTDVWRSRHHIMSRLATHNKVLFASAPYYVREVFELTERDKTESGLSKIAENFYSYIPPKWLPYNYRFSRLDGAIADLRSRHLQQTLKKLGMEAPVLYIWHPSMLDLVGRFEESLVVYHVYDEYSSFTDQTEWEVDLIKKQETELLRKADIVFAASEEILERKRAFNANTHLVRNAVDYDLFSRAVDPNLPVPEDLKSISGPIVGCVTTQTPYMDLKLIRDVFTRRADWSFVFVGVELKTGESGNDDLLALQRMRNVHFIGRRKIFEIPGYLKGFDVCAIPWLLNDVTLVSSSPLKLYEYFAAGKPIVCKPLPLLAHLKDTLYFASTPDEWISAIEQALKSNGTGEIEKRQALARENTWDQRTEFIALKIASELAAREEL
jgi:glycosyltransferase involved in cell wall biosynthesis